MSHKRCIFKNCLNTGASDATLFSFPKDEARRKAWLMNAGRPNYSPQKMDFLCELHFGPQFISTNQRRKILVGIAVPFQCDQETEDEEHLDVLEDRLDELQQIFASEDEIQEDVASYSSGSLIDEVIDEYSPEMIVCDESDAPAALPPPNEIKRRIVKAQSTSEPMIKMLKVEHSTQSSSGTEPSTSSQYRNDTLHPKQCSSTIIDHPDVSTFNIRGEEFIQMPKAVYLDEKERLENNHKNRSTEEISKLKRELDKYKKIVLNIKNQLNSI